jgi:Nuclease subunit of the excinuclease complex
MPKKSRFKYSLEGMPLYPHIKLTSEKFPRPLATRIIANDNAEYFGAFLNRTGARMLIDFLNRTFKLRSCDIPIDGSWNYPCTMYYKRRCLAPCVEDLTDESSYEELVGLVRMFLANERGLLSDLLNTRIRISSNDLDFEEAAKWRDILAAVEEYWADTRHTVWLDGSSDTFHVTASDEGLDVFLVSQKGKRVLGERVFSFSGATEAEASDALADVIEQFYKNHAPKEIRVSRDFSDRIALSKALSEKFGRKIPILLLNDKNQRLSTGLAMYRSTAELDVKRSIIATSPSDLMAELKRAFALPRIPRRITAIDVAHISGTNQVAAAIVWANGKNISNAAEYYLSDSSSELETLGEFVKVWSVRRSPETAELLLIDGGRSQLNAALAQKLSPNIYVVSAVKPPGEHSEISHFLSADRRVKFDVESDAHRLLQSLRDDAHEFANAVHRDTRDLAHFYAVVNLLPTLKETERQKILVDRGSIAAITASRAGDLAEVVGGERAEIAMQDIERYKTGQTSHIKPLVVPISFQAENGAAEDLRPILSRKPSQRASADRT